MTIYKDARNSWWLLVRDIALAKKTMYRYSEYIFEHVSSNTRSAPYAGSKILIQRIQFIYMGILSMSMALPYLPNAGLAASHATLNVRRITGKAGQRVRNSPDSLCPGPKFPKRRRPNHQTSKGLVRFNRKPLPRPPLSRKDPPQSDFFFHDAVAGDSKKARRLAEQEEPPEPRDGAAPAAEMGHARS